uniref:Putative secreted protein n=1 Tax=Ixodes ricinus TaxID=34613 RepID=A0A6B0V170_IXORI
MTLSCMDATQPFFLVFCSLVFVLLNVTEAVLFSWVLCRSLPKRHSFCTFEITLNGTSRRIGTAPLSKEKRSRPGFPSKLSCLGSLEDAVLKETPMVKSSRSMGSSASSFSKCPVHDSPILLRFFTYFRSTASSSSSDIGRATLATSFHFAKNPAPALRGRAGEEHDGCTVTVAKLQPP